MERLIRERALDTQLLFGSSEAVLLKCVGTSENLVKSLLPFLKVAVEKNKPQLALDLLEKAKGWIADIISEVKTIVQRYDKHNHDVGTSTSDIIDVKKKTEQKQEKQTNEMEALQKIVDNLEEKLHNINNKIKDSEKKIDDKNAEMQKFISKITSAGMSRMGSKVSFFSKIVPFVESVMDYIWKMVTSTSDEKVIEAFNAALSALTSEQQRLKKEEWEIQNELMPKQLQLAKLKIESGQMPSVTHLDEVQKCLSRIQQILVQLQKFWEKVGSLLDTMEKETFAGENCIKYLAELKEEFLESIDKAKEGWIQFGINCMMANKIFSVQSNQAYRFLEINPSSLSTEEWQKEYESVKEKLEKIRPNTVNKAITQ